MIGYFITVILLLLVALAAWRPPRKPARGATLAYLVGWLINEAPLWGLVWLAASTALTYSEGYFAEDLILTVVALGIAAAAAAVLIRLAVRSRSPAGAFEDGLAEVLPGTTLGDGPGWWRSAALPLYRRRLGIRHVRNLSYAEHGRRNRLDVYHHRTRTPAGVFIHLHGGHFRIGHKDSQSLPLLYDLAHAGWLCISANYRLEPRWSYPDYVVDTKKVIAWARENAAGFGADPTRIVVSGDSAGGYLAVFAALTANDPAYQPGFADADTRIDAALGLYGYYGRTVEDPASSPLAHLTPDAAPMMLVHGTHDSDVPVEWARSAQAKLRRASRQPVVYVEVPGAQHGFDYLRSPRSEALTRATIAFLSAIDNSGPTSGSSFPTSIDKDSPGCESVPEHSTAVQSSSMRAQGGQGHA